MTGEEGGIQKETRCVEFKAGLKPDGFPKVLECDDSIFEVEMVEGKFKLTRTTAKTDDPLFPLDTSLMGESLIVYKEGLVILCNEKGAIFAMSCINGPF